MSDLRRLNAWLDERFKALPAEWEVRLKLSALEYAKEKLAAAQREVDALDGWFEEEALCRAEREAAVAAWRAAKDGEHVRGQEDGSPLGNDSGRAEEPDKEADR